MLLAPLLTPAPLRAFEGCVVLTALSFFFGLDSYPVGGHLPLCGPQFVSADDICLSHVPNGSLRLPFFFLVACTIVSGIYAAIEFYQDSKFKGGAAIEVARQTGSELL